MSSLCKCFFPGCKDRTTPRQRFPHPHKDAKLRFGEWLRIIQNPILFEMKPIEVYNRCRICRSHFSASQYYGCNPKFRLSDTAIPDIFPPAASDVPSSATSMNEVSCNSSDSMAQISQTDNESPSTSAVTVTLDMKFYDAENDCRLNMGLRKCCVPGCEDKTTPRQNFPHPKKDAKGRFAEWLRLIGNLKLQQMEPMLVYRHAMICKSHFSEKQFYGNNPNFRLSYTAIPDRFLPAAPDSLSISTAIEASQPVNCNISEVKFNSTQVSQNGMDLCREGIERNQHISNCISKGSSDNYPISLDVTNPHSEDVCISDLLEPISSDSRVLPSFSECCTQKEFEVLRLPSPIVGCPDVLPSSNATIETIQPVCNNREGSCCIRDLSPDTIEESTKDCGMLFEDDRSEEESVALQNVKEKLCRVCGHSEHSLTPIFGDTLMTQNFSLPLPEVMEMHLPLKLQADDHFPSNICSKCLNTLSEWHDLYATCATADKAFRNAFGERNTQESWKRTLCPKLPEEEFRRSDARRVLEAHDYVQEAYSITEQQFQSLIDVPFVKEHDYAVEKHGNRDEEVRLSVGFSSLDSCDFVQEKYEIREKSQGYLSERNEHSLELEPSNISPKVLFVKKTYPVKSMSKNDTRHQLGMAQSQPLSIIPEETAVESIKQNYIQTVCNVKEKGYFKGCIDSEKSFFCKYCRDAFKEKIQLRVHYKECQEKTTMCEICGRTMVQKNLVRHKRRKHGMLIICEKCGKCVSKIRWYDHMKSAHSDSKYCEMCYSVIRPSSYVLHMKNHASGKVKPNFSVSSILMDGKSVYICPVCHKHFDDKVSLIVHLNEPIIIKCSTCRSRVTNEKRFLLHKCKHWNCQFCSKNFFNREQWKEHERIHTGEKPHKCKECNISFRTMSQKTIHLRNHRAPAYDCNSCSKKFRLPSELMDHMRRIHEGVRFTCEICSKKFSRKLSMKKHLQIHLREVVHFSCQVCDKKFTREVFLKKHLRKHIPELLTMRTV